jgi:predicted amidohydrolase
LPQVAALGHDAGMTLRVACVQMDSGPDMAANLAAASALVREAAQAGAQIVATPEVTDQVLPPTAERAALAHAEEAHPAVPLFSALAAEHKIWLLVGSVSVKSETPDRCANRSLLFAADGRLVARYDKIHLYDAALPTGERHKESRVFAPGGRAALADTPWGRLGMSVCYDLRFPHLYRDLAKAGAVMLCVPAAFTVPTGRAHWSTLLRARAIEAGAFVLAPAQGGAHGGARQTWGHSMIVDPWGHVLAELPGQRPGVLMANLDLAEAAAARAAIPALCHDRFYERPWTLPTSGV